MVNLEWYRTFKAVYQTGSLTAASKALFISQPNVSQHISALEAYIGQQLFERKPKLIPTDHGKLFYTQLIAPLEKLEHLEATFTALCNNRQLPAIRLGTVKEIFHSVLLKKLPALPADMITTFGLTKDLLAKLGNGELDFVIATQRTDRKDIFFEPVLTESFVIAAHPAADCKKFRALLKKNDLEKAEEWLLQQTWYAYSTDLAIIRRFWLTNFNKRPTIKPRYVIPDMNTILQSISNSEGFTVAADYLVKDLQKEGKLQVIWKGAVPTTNVIYLAYDKTKTTSKQVEVVKSLLA
ncbi:LysR family transcriptional regulator [Chitinophaga qingshengii]|uniref:LysR family transcriptional regulator n=1 Tax=Chitinophaga qingshengii TaxID=1569794 RepID=A0ABR7TNJ7_9BACT|nr:LysR family transcriptional regulator [Chitinophaga qingshengii]MBC9931107.1 LysR family transcriptional regulator [Chitinophaga qingshengii]